MKNLINEKEYLFTNFRQVGIILCEGYDNIFALDFINKFSKFGINFIVYFTEKTEQIYKKSLFYQFTSVKNVINIVDNNNYKLDLLVAFGKNLNDSTMDTETLNTIKNQFFDSNTPIIILENGICYSCTFKLIDKNSLIVLKNDESSRRLSYNDIIWQAMRYLYGKSYGELKSLNIIVTSGGTSELIDPVRIITNKSSGKMGKAIAEALQLKGANVKYIYAKNSIDPPLGVEKVSFYDTTSLKEEIFKSINNYEVIIMVAAVSDFKVKKQSESKIKKNNSGLILELIEINNFIKDIPDNILKIGIAAETDMDLDKAINKMINRGFDYLCLNKISDPGSGFEVDYNKITLIGKSGVIYNTSLDTKPKIAMEIVEKLITELHFR